MNNQNRQTTYYLLALAVSIGLLFHGASFFNTLENTYDAYVHVFFSNHYAKSWFEPWEPRWYTGFNMVSYPPLLHQLVALMSFIGGLRFAAYSVSFAIVVLYVTGSYRFAKLICANEESAGYAALIAVFLPSVVEALHVFGQLPMMLGISWLLHALPEIYKYIRYGRWRYFLCGLSLIAVGVCSHHVTPIFGMVFFVLPLMGTAIMDGARQEVGSYRQVRIKQFITYTLKYLKRIVIFGFSTIGIAIFVILPYWLWSKSDPIAQIPIPHGSRDDFLEVFSSGLTFFVIPWGFLFFMMPFYFYRYFSKRNLFFGLSFTLLTILGTGGTTPIAITLLGENAFNILTLERFTFWATIYAMPLAGEFLWRFTKGNIYHAIVSRRSSLLHSVYVVMLIVSIFFSAGFTMNFNFFRPLQPKSIEIKPILNFLESDKHYKWRYLTLGFGDQMAWLSANTRALSIDGNYHSARRIPELTSRAVERLENSKYKGMEGIQTLQQFLSTPEKFHLKYIFSNDKFYDPILYFSGWHRVKLLDNGIMVWERSDVSSLPSVLPKTNIPHYQKLLWGSVPLLTLLLAFFFNIQMHWIRHIKGTQRKDSYLNTEPMSEQMQPILYFIIKYWIAIVFGLVLLLIGKVFVINLGQATPQKAISSYYDALDFKEFQEAHEILDPDTRSSLAYFLLEQSVTDGLVDSYGKVNSIKHEVLSNSGKYAKVRTTLEWVTPLETYTRVREHETVKKGLKWYIVYDLKSKFVPTNQFTDIPSNHYLNQGRRRISTEETFHEDVLDRPVVRVRSARLVKKGKQYYLIGLIQNLDNHPVDLTVKAQLLDSTGTLVTSYDDKFHLIHKLLPKEVTAFRIDFDEVSWQAHLDTLASQHTHLFLPPTQFNISVLGTVTTVDLYKDIAILDLGSSIDHITGELYNFGSQTASISQFIISYYDADGELIWVDTSLVEKSTFPGKTNAFDIPVLEIDSINLITKEKPKAILVNGLPNEIVTTKYASGDVHGYNQRLNNENLKGGFLQLQVNNFVGGATHF